MTDSELLTIIISGLSFFVSFRGIIIAKKAVAKADEANALSREQNVLALRQAKSAELSFFEQCLFRIEQRLKIPLYDLCRKAREALINVSKLFDKYDRRENDSEFLRHIFHEFCSAMGSGLSSQITWQTSEYLHSELSSLYSMDDEVINIERIINSFDLNIYFGPFPKRNGFLKLKHNRVPGDAVDWGEKLKKIYD
ncbi:MAG: hypothetical protein J2P31_05295, partial [Blastocatellia bacterium]|nr:hypothetical protein [Blastocatellia bacterium]